MLNIILVVPNRISFCKQNQSAAANTAILRRNSNYTAIITETTVKEWLSCQEEQCSSIWKELKIHWQKINHQLSFGTSVPIVGCKKVFGKNIASLKAANPFFSTQKIKEIYKNL